VSREVMLGQICSALGRRGSDAERRRGVEERLARPPAPLLPERARLPLAQRIAQFERLLGAQGTDVIAAAEKALIPAAIAGYLRGHDLPLRLRKGADAYLSALLWLDEGDLTLAEDGPADPEDQVGLSRAIAGVAETGTLVLASGTDNPVTLAFLPETHVVVLSREAIVGSYEDAIGLLEMQLGPGEMPRTLNFITGASRTGDIGGRIVMGAHGPRRLAVVIVDEG
jgi:L-lactate dehydrogenase complex protein LldG